MQLMLLDVVLVHMFDDLRYLMLLEVVHMLGLMLPHLMLSHGVMLRERFC